MTAAVGTACAFGGLGFWVQVLGYGVLYAGFEGFGERV